MTLDKRTNLPDLGVTASRNESSAYGNIIHDDDRVVFSISDYFDDNLVRYDDDVILSQLNEDIVRTNIVSQIKSAKDVDIHNEGNSYFDYFESRYRYLVNKYKDATDGPTLELKDEADTVYRNILALVHSTIEDTFDFHVVFSEDTSIDTLIEYIRAEYSFFVLNLREKLSDFAFTWVSENMDALCEKYNDTTCSDDLENLSYQSLSAIMDNKNTLPIYHLSDSLKDYQGDGVDFIKTATKLEPAEYTNYHITDELVFNDDADSVEFGDDFVPGLKDVLVSNADILTTTQARLVSKYARAKSELSDVVDSDDM